MKDFLRDQIESCVTATTRTGSFHIDYKIGPVGARLSVCKVGFGIAYDKGKTYLDSLIAGLKITIGETEGKIRKQVRNSDRPLSNRSSPPDDKEIEAMKVVGRQLQIPNMTTVTQNAKLGNSPIYLACVCWMEAYFKVVGCHPPNSGGEIHLDFVEKTDVHEEYASVRYFITII